MADAGVRGVSDLHNQLEKAKERLKNVDQTIKKLTGRDPTEVRNNNGAGRGFRRMSGGREGGGALRSPVTEQRIGPGRIFSMAGMGMGSPAGPSPARKSRGAFSRLGPRVIASSMGRVRPDSGDDEESADRLAVHSSVTPAEPRSRIRSIEEATNQVDKKGCQRNRRMFGLLMGTLQKFKQEAKQKQDQDVKRKEIEQKLEVKAREDKDQARQERQQLFEKRREEQQEMRRLEQKLERVQSHETWEKQTRQLMHFARTDSEPHIFYRPKMFNHRAERKLKATQKLLEGIILERRKTLEEEIEQLTKKSQEEEDEEMEEEEEDNRGEQKGSGVERGGGDGQTVTAAAVAIVKEDCQTEEPREEAEDKENLDQGVQDVKLDVMDQDEESHDAVDETMEVEVKDEDNRHEQEKPVEKPEEDDSKNQCEEIQTDKKEEEQLVEKEEEQAAQKQDSTVEKEESRESVEKEELIENREREETTVEPVEKANENEVDDDKNKSDERKTRERSKSEKSHRKRTTSDGDRKKRSHRDDSREKKRRRRHRSRSRSRDRKSRHDRRGSDRKRDHDSD